MNNNKYHEINIPTDLDIRIDDGIKKARLEKFKNNRYKKRRLIATIAASLVALITLGIANPALAAKIPIIGGVFEAIEKNIYFPGSYSQYSNSVNETTYSNDIEVTLSEILCDGQSLYVTYIIHNEEGFKYTSLGDSGKMDMNQLITEEAYNKVDFTDEELDNSGIAGLEGKFINENTFVGVEKYNLALLEEEIPDKFTFQTKINLIENYGVSDSDTSYYKRGTWAFKVPVTVNKDLRKVLGLNGKDIESDVVKIKSISITPFDMVIDVKYKTGIWSNYRCNIYDESGEILLPSNSQISNNGVNAKMFFQAPNLESNYIRIIVEKAILRDESEKYKGNGTVSEEKNYEVVFDKIIQLK